MFSAARIDLSAIPEDQRDIVAALLREHDELKGENSDLKHEATSLREIVKRLENLVAELNHAVHGKKSEKLSENDRHLAFEDLETVVAEVEEQHDSRTASDDAPRRKSAPGGTAATCLRVCRGSSGSSSLTAWSAHAAAGRCTRPAKIARSGSTSCPRSCT